jgi:HrpA-like RNA helicase
MIVLDASVKGDEQEYAIDEFKYKQHPTANPNKPFTRKIVFATNVAESSLTVSGIIFVIDSGLALEDYYDHKRSASALFEKYVSQSAIKQRRGRAGRVQPGICYHLYTEKDYNNFIKYPIPSIEKSDLTMDILDMLKISYIKNFGDVEKLMNDMMSPPHPIFIKNARNNLYSMEAITSLDNNATITELGKAIAKFSGVPIQYARAIIASYYYRCKYDVIPIIVILSMLKGRIKDLYLEYKPKTKLNNS